MCSLTDESRPSMRERSVAAAQQPAVRQRVAGALQRVLDMLVANLDTKARAYKNKARCFREFLRFVSERC